MNVVLIGYGEVGKAVHDVYSPFHLIDIVDPDKGFSVDKRFDNYDIMLVTIPFSNDFVEIVSKYQQDFKTRCKVIFSSVPIGTTSKLKDAVHVPVEGKHPNLTESLTKWQVFMGGFHQMAYDFFLASQKLPCILEKPEHTEFLKLQSTTNYGLAIEYARYCNEICEDLGMDYGKINTYNHSYNCLYNELGASQYSRYILEPPQGTKGGHCVNNNALILRKQYPSPLVDIVAEVKPDDV
jgi:hypothetical protein